MTLRFAGDDLDPDEISAVLPVKPTRAHRKGEEFFAGPRAGNLRGRTGMWFLATDKLVPSDDLQDHLAFVQKLLSPRPGDTSRIAKLREILERTHSRAHVTCFWRGEPGEPAPQIPDRFKSADPTLGRRHRNRFCIRQTSVVARVGRAFMLHPPAASIPAYDVDRNRAISLRLNLEWASLRRSRMVSKPFSTSASSNS